MATTVTFKHINGPDESVELMGYWFDSGYIYMAVTKYHIKIKNLKDVCDIHVTPDPDKTEVNLQGVDAELDEITKDILNRFALKKDDTGPGTKH